MFFFCDNVYYNFARQKLELSKVKKKREGRKGERRKEGGREQAYLRV